jgi:SAM-dependent methyltransferase
VQARDAPTLQQKEQLVQHSGTPIRDRGAILLRQAKQALPPRLRRQLQFAADRAVGLVTPGIPPPEVRRVISPTWLDFKRSGRDQVEFLVESAGLRPNDRVLDIACGCGRVALPLSRYLTTAGSYEGFDISQSSIDWCQEHIHRHHENFRFQLVHVAANSNNPEDTRPPAAAFRFPYRDQAFDLVFAGSIFTHLLPEGATHYLDEVARVLDGGGRFVATWLLFNADAEGVVPGRSLTRLWPHDHDAYRVMDKDHPELSVNYEERKVRGWYAERGLTIAEPIRVDATYCPARIPADRQQGLHLYYAHSIVAAR